MDKSSFQDKNLVKFREVYLINLMESKLKLDIP